MPIRVSDVRSNPADQIAHVVEVLGHARQRIAIFRTIYFGKKKSKTINEIAMITGLSRIRVLQEGKRLVDNQIVKQIGTAGAISYGKDSFFSIQKNKILRLVQNPIEFAGFPTKTRPRASIPPNISILIPRSRIRIRSITIDDIDSFYRVRKIRVDPGKYTAISETKFKKGIKKILGESGCFQDWGGEKNDLYTNKIRILGHRYQCAFALKGPGQKGILTPRHMGKNGDQIQRLFKTAANVFMIQYWGQVAESIFEQMEEFAKAKSATEGSIVFFGIIDGDDSNRIIKAYSKSFL